MKLYYLTLTLIGFSFSNTLSFAQTASSMNTAATIEYSRSYTLVSEISGVAYQIDVLRAASILQPPSPDYRLPVIFVLDGNTLFPLVSQMAATNLPLNNRIPAVLVVSIGYAIDPSVDRANNLANRNSWRTLDDTPASSSVENPSNGTGGAMEFLAFIQNQVKPFVASNYSVDNEKQTLVGHSLGGLFTIYTLLNSPNAFQNYVALSPSLFWDQHALISQAERLVSPEILGTGTLFVGIGGLETRENMGEDMIGDSSNFVNTLTNRQGLGLEVKFQVFENENHQSMVPGALMRGLREVGALP